MHNIHTYKFTNICTHVSHTYIIAYTNILVRIYSNTYLRSFQIPFSHKYDSDLISDFTDFTLPSLLRDIAYTPTLFLFLIILLGETAITDEHHMVPYTLPSTPY